MKVSRASESLGWASMECRLPPTAVVLIRFAQVRRETVEVGAVRAGGRQAAQKKIAWVGRLVAQYGQPSSSAPSTFIKQRLAGAEEAADPDADALLILADGGIGVGVEHAVQVAPPTEG